MAGAWRHSCATLRAKEERRDQMNQPIYNTSNHEFKRAYGEFRDPSNYARCEMPAKGASRFHLVVQFSEGARSWQIAFQESPKPEIILAGDAPTQEEFRRAIPASVAYAAIVDALWLAVMLATENDKELS